MTDDQPADPGRRQFFRRLGRETAATAGSAVGAADSMRRGSTAIAGDLLGFGVREPTASAARLAEPESAPPTAGAFASAYRYTGDALVLLDQRLLPDGRGEVTCREPTELATAFRMGVVGGGPILGEIAAYALVIAAERAADRPEALAAGRMDAAAATLAGARPNVRALRLAVERMMSAYRAAPADTPVALLAEADAVAAEAARSHAAIGRIGADVLATAAPAGPMNVLLHGDMGPLSCGLVGTGFAMIQATIGGGRPVHVYVTEGGPRAEGRRVSAHQLSQLDVPHTVVPDAAVAWLLAKRPMHAVLIRADTVFANGDVSGPLGTAAVAQLAAAAGVPVHAVGAASSIDPRATGEEIALEVGAQGGLAPLSDVAPAAAIEALITEMGPRRPPFAAA